MKIKQDKDSPSIFHVESESHKGKYYDVDIGSKTCNCVHFIMRLKKSGQKCKHIIAAEEFAEKNIDMRNGASSKHKNIDDNSIIDFIKENKEVDSVEFIKKYSEEKLNDLKQKGIIIEEHEKIRLLE